MNRDKQGVTRGRCGCGHYQVYVSKDGLRCSRCGSLSARDAHTSTQASRQFTNERQRAKTLDQQRDVKPTQYSQTTEHTRRRETDANIHEDRNELSTGKFQGFTTAASPRDVGSERFSNWPAAINLGRDEVGILGSQKSKYVNYHTKERKDQLEKTWPKESQTNQNMSIQFPKQVVSDSKYASNRNESRSLQNAIDKLHTQQTTRKVVEGATRPINQHKSYLDSLYSTSGQAVKDKADTSKKCGSKQKPFTVGSGQASERSMPITPGKAERSNTQVVWDRQQGCVDLTKSVSTSAKYLDHIQKAAIKTKQDQQKVFSKNTVDKKQGETGPSTSKENVIVNSDVQHSSPQERKVMSKSSGVSEREHLRREMMHTLTKRPTDQRVDAFLPTIPFPSAKADQNDDHGVKSPGQIPLLNFPTLPTNPFHTSNEILSDGSFVGNPGQIPLLPFPIQPSSVDLSHTGEDHRQALIQKTPAADTSFYGGESAEKKRKIQGMDVTFPTLMQTTESEVKPCQLLAYGDLPWRDIYGIGPTIKGVYKIAYKGKAVYVGGDSCNVIKQLRAQFKGSGQRELFNFLTSLTVEARQQLSVNWLDERYFQHTCGQSYLRCVEYIQGQKPTFNGVTRKSLDQYTHSDNSFTFAQQAMDTFNVWKNLEEAKQNDQMFSVKPEKAGTFGMDIKVETGSNQEQIETDLVLQTWLSEMSDTPSLQGLNTSTFKAENSVQNTVIDLTDDEVFQRSSQTQNIKVETGSDKMKIDTDLGPQTRLSDMPDTPSLQGLNTSTFKAENSVQDTVIDLSDDVVSQPSPETQDQLLQQEEHIKSRSTAFLNMSKPMANVQNDLTTIIEETPTMPSSSLTLTKTEGIDFGSSQTTVTPATSGNSSTTQGIPSCQKINIPTTNRTLTPTEEIASGSSHMSSIQTTSNKSLTTEEMPMCSTKTTTTDTTISKLSTSEAVPPGSSQTTITPTKSQKLQTGDGITSGSFDMINIPIKSCKLPTKEKIISDFTQQKSKPAKRPKLLTEDGTSPDSSQTTIKPTKRHKLTTEERLPSDSSETTSKPAKRRKLSTEKETPPDSSQTTNKPTKGHRLPTKESLLSHSSQQTSKSVKSPKLQKERTPSDSSKTTNKPDKSPKLSTKDRTPSVSLQTTNKPTKSPKLPSKERPSSDSSQTTNKPTKRHKLTTEERLPSDSSETTSKPAKRRKLSTEKETPPDSSQTTNKPTKGHRLPKKESLLSHSSQQTSKSVKSPKLQKERTPSDSSKTTNKPDKSPKLSTKDRTLSVSLQTTNKPTKSHKLQTKERSMSCHSETTTKPVKKDKLPTKEQTLSDSPQTTSKPTTRRKLPIGKGITSASPQTTSKPTTRRKLPIGEGIPSDSPQTTSKPTTSRKLPIGEGIPSDSSQTKHTRFETSKLQREDTPSDSFLTTYAATKSPKLPKGVGTLPDAPDTTCNPTVSPKLQQRRGLSSSYSQETNITSTSRREPTSEDAISGSEDEQDTSRSSQSRSRSTWSALTETISTGFSWMFGKK